MSWENNTLGELLIIKGGKRLPKGCEFITTPNNHLYIRARDIKDGKIDIQEPVYLDENTFEQISNYIVNKDDIVITIVGANIGDIGEITEEFDGCNLTENAVKLMPNNLDVLYPKFLKYSIYGDYQKNKFQQIASGSAQGKLGIYKIKTFEIKVPPLETQKRIASILSTYDDLIENNLKRIKLLEETAQNIYKEWFVNFRFPNYEHTEFDAESGLPLGWEMKKVEDCEIKIGDGNYSAKYPKSEEFIELGIPFFSTKEMSDGRFNTDGVKRISEEQHLTLTKGHLKGGDVILSTRGSIGKVVYVDAEFEDCNINAQLVLFRCDNLNVYSKFLYYQLSMPQTFLRLINVGTGTAQPQLPIKTLKYFKLLIASPKLQQAFDNAVKLNMEQISILSKQNQKLKEARDILLPRLMNRTIEV